MLEHHLQKFARAIRRMWLEKMGMNEMEIEKELYDCRFSKLDIFEELDDLDSSERIEEWNEKYTFVTGEDGKPRVERKT